MSTNPPSEPAPLPALAWIWFVFIGTICLIVGVIGIVDLGMAYALTEYSVLIFGILMTIAGAAHMIGAIFARPIWNAALGFICGALYLVAGVIAILEPRLAAEAYTLFLAIMLIASGIMRFVLAFAHRQAITWLGMALGGFITILVGVYILRRWPWDSVWVIGLFIAIDLLIQGASWISLGFSLRKVAQAMRAGMPMEFRTRDGNEA
ncbi:MAG TPA: HdeD family acid-resistance protein [Gemmataceae bacterium]|nr:HdeD family acid-resistance protein [Gemmataceae bacterium]